MGALPVLSSEKLPNGRTPALPKLKVGLSKAQPTKTAGAIGAIQLSQAYCSVSVPMVICNPRIPVSPT